MLRLRASGLALHAARLAVGPLVLAAPLPLPVAAMVSAALFMALFTVAHDASHGALGLSRRANTWLLSLVTVPMMISGHAMRRMHAIHHARPLTEEDVEGDGARRSALGALLMGPVNAVVLRVAAFRRAPGRERAVQVVETLAGLGLAAALVASGRPVLVVHVAVTLVMQLTMSLWASHIAHHAPPWAIRASRRLAFLRSPVLLSLAFHELHHRNPRVPCQELASVR